MKKVIASALVVLFVSGCANNPSNSALAAKPVAIAMVHKGDLNSSLTFPGNLHAINEVDVSPKSAGKISGLFVDTGDSVKNGKTIATLDATTEKATAYSLEQNLTQAQNSYKAVEQLYDERLKSAEQMVDITKKSGAQNIAILERQIAEAKNNTLASTTDLGDASVGAVQSQIEAAQKSLETRTANALDNVTLITKQVEDVVGPIVIDNYHGINLSQYELGMLDENQKFKTANEFGEFTLKEKEFNESVGSDQDKKLLLAIDLLSKITTLLSDAQSVLGKSVISINLSEAQLRLYQGAVVSLAAQNATLLQNLRDLYGTNGVAGQIDVLEKQATQTEAQAAASKSNINTQITLLEDQLVKARIDVDGQITQAELGLSILQKEKASQLANAGASLTQLTGQAGVTSTLVDNGVIQAPFSGIITSKYVENGSVVSPGMPLFHLADDSRLKLVVEVPDNISSSFQTGKEASVIVSGYEKGPISSHISKIYPTANPLSKKVALEFVIENPGHQIKPGSFATVTFSIPAKDQLIIPSGAIVSRYGSNFVFVVKNQRAIQTVVETGSSNDSDTAILAGLNEGESVIVKGNAYLQDGDLISPILDNIVTQ
jgi:multidrug efflux pump subunit AcrA (membrane-fusion protein)